MMKNISVELQTAAGSGIVETGQEVLSNQWTTWSIMAVAGLGVLTVGRAYLRQARSEQETFRNLWAERGPSATTPVVGKAALLETYQAIRGRQGVDASAEHETPSQSPRISADALPRPDEKRPPIRLWPGGGEAISYPEPSDTRTRIFPGMREASTHWGDTDYGALMGDQHQESHEIGDIDPDSVD